MCRFCVEHGDGKKWYLRAENYSQDLLADMNRRAFMVDFVRDFDRTRYQGLTALDIVGAWPRPLRSAVHAWGTRRQQRDHFGQAVPIEDVDKIFDITTSIVQLPCVCRRFAGTHEGGYCLLLTTAPAEDILVDGFKDYVDGPDIGDFHQLTKDRALALVRGFEEQGLMHSLWTFITPFIGAICNCDLASGCMAMRVTRQYDFKVMFKGEYVAAADPELCTGCAKCVKHCPFEAIEYDKANRKAAVRGRDCYGCGVCRAACEAGALTLTDRAAVPELAGVW